MYSEKCPRGISCLFLDIGSLPKGLQWECYVKYLLPRGQVLNNVLLLRRTLLEVLCHWRYLFQRPVPSPSSALTRGVTPKRSQSLSGFNSRPVVWREGVNEALSKARMLRISDSFWQVPKDSVVKPTDLTGSSGAYSPVKERQLLNAWQ